MNRMIQSPATESSNSGRPLPSLLGKGFRLALLNWPCVVWAYGVNLVFGLLAGVPFASGLKPFLDHSLAAQRIAGTIDIASLQELDVHLRDTSFFPTAIRTASWLGVLQVLVLFVFFTGTVFVYVSSEPPRLSVLLRGGVAYFWRFVRAAILAGGIGILIVGILLAARAGLLARADAVFVDRKMFVYSAISGALVLLAALLLRLWWDLVEVYLVRNAMDGTRRVRPALLPALRLLWRYFFRTAGSFLLAGVSGVSALAFCLFIWNRVVPAHQVWLACLVAQLGLFLLLASRFWQRGIEAVLVMSADPPMVVLEESVATIEEAIPVAIEQEMPVPVDLEAWAGKAEPTLQDLLLKLQAQPLASPDVVPPPRLRPSFDPLKGNEPLSSLLDKHEKKFPLGGVGPGEPPANFDEKANILDAPEKPPHAAKKPLP
jgi:hypothetical protein